ncbi:hypothetical protein HUJ05_004673 [Dendroctonus ponderosae]|nr:hypothetical protein HUJ05_004673 [Dendroctonus ponderosae]
MSTAMRSTLQTVPESLEVTKPNTTSPESTTIASTKVPAKATGEVVATKTSRPYNYASSTNKEG